MAGKRDLTTVMIYNEGEGKELIFSSAYLPYEAADPITQQLRDLVAYGSRANNNLVIGCDANAHHVILGISDVKRRGEKVLDFLRTKTKKINRDHARSPRREENQSHPSFAAPCQAPGGVTPSFLRATHVKQVIQTKKITNVTMFSAISFVSVRDVFVLKWCILKKAMKRVSASFSNTDGHTN